jgi:ketopantoate hydroxymethyltransferase
MDDFETGAETVTTEEAFTTALRNLVQAAHANGVDIEGGWECRTTTEDPDWEIMILELAKQDTQKRDAVDGGE